MASYVLVNLKLWYIEFHIFCYYFLQDTHKRYHVTCPQGQDMGWLMWVQCWIFIFYLSLACDMHICYKLLGYDEMAQLCWGSWMSGVCILACLTHRGRDKMAIIFQRTFSNAFSSMLNFFILMKISYSSIGSVYGLAPVRRQAIVWTMVA